MNRRIKILIFAVCIVLALGVTLYPLVSNIVGERYMSIVESRYDKAVEKLGLMDLIAEKEKAVEYNKTLQGGTANAFSREALAQAEESYGSLLNVRGDGIMGYVQIPKIGVELPIYHGTSDATLDKGVGHLLGTSLPVGGIGTHCVLTGHSGLAGTKMFSDLDQLKKGDVFYIRVLDETHAYMILDINTVLPEDTSKLEIDPQRESVTLVTCTPFGVNTHRLLIRGERIEVSMAERIVEDTEIQEEPAKSTWTQEYLKGIGLGCLGIIVLTALILGVRFLLNGRYPSGIRYEQRRGRHEKT
jgi:sortase A